ncbi:hypothetical protein CRYUN_Cryun03dG0063500 [Craigia yunnanensis]
MSSESKELQLSKKAAKKEAAKLEKMRRRQEAASLASSASSLSVEEEDPYSSNYGDVPLPELKSCSQADAGNWSRAIASMDWVKLEPLPRS